MTDHLSPFAVEFPKMPPVAGVRIAAASTGMRYQKRNDVMLVELAEGTTVAGVFTKNAMTGAPVDWCRSIVKRGTARALIVNAGISNVFTGAAGQQVVKDTAAAVAQIFHCDAQDVYVSSTGIIGQLPDKDKLLASLPTLHHKLKETAWAEGARAILTTDTFAKGITRKATIGGAEVTLNGFIKGSGMIEPNMATMLGYVFTDAKIPANVLQELLSADTEVSYNSMTVDSDTSTSDTILVFATGKADHWAITKADAPELQDFREKLREIHIELAKLVAFDGEGISKFITVKVRGAKDDVSARAIAKSIANSPLVKTAVAGEDANWGRVAMAIGKSGQKVNRDKTSIWFGPHLIAKDGTLNPDYKEAQGASHLQGKHIDIAADVGVGSGEATVWTCDLTHEYISINADYRS